MKSRITIEIDFDNQRKPFIQIIQRTSDDIRDRLVSDFLELLDDSSMCSVDYIGEFISDGSMEYFKRWAISPIEPEPSK